VRQRQAVAAGRSLRQAAADLPHSFPFKKHKQQGGITGTYKIIPYQQENPFCLTLFGSHHVAACKTVSSSECSQVCIFKMSKEMLL
jgi:hypothetical protein